MSERPQPTFSRRTFLKGLVGVGAVLGIPGCSTPQSTPDSKPTLPQTTPTTTETPSPTTLPSTSIQETTTTVAERVFSSPEQKAQVETLESNMAKFYQLTPDDLKNYEEKATFIPYPDGFTTIGNDGANSTVLAVNLGILPVGFGAEGTGNLQFFGCVDNFGNSYVMSTIASIPDSEYTQRYPNWSFDQKFGINVWNPVGKPNEYRTTTNGQSGGLKELIRGDEAVQYLNAGVGQPVSIEMSSFDRDAGVGIVPNQTLISIMDEIHRASGRKLTDTLSSYPSDQLESVGIFNNPGLQGKVELPQSLINGFPGGFRQAFQSFSVALISSMFSQTPPLI